MTVLQQQNATNIAGQGVNPGGAPLGAGVMNGNPTNQTPTGAVVPAPQNSNSESLHDLVANGNIPLNVQPTNVSVTPGGDSLLAQQARGQLMRGDSTYGQSGFIPANGGASPQAAQPAQNAVQTVTTGLSNAAGVSGYNAGGLTFANPPNYTGN